MKFTDDQLTNQRLSDKIHDLEIKVTELEDREALLDALEVAGVDNWTGYDEALREYNEAKA